MPSEPELQEYERLLERTLRLLRCREVGAAGWWLLVYGLVRRVERESRALLGKEDA